MVPECVSGGTVIAAHRGEINQAQLRIAAAGVETADLKLDGIRKTLHQVDKIRYRPALLRKIANGYFRTLVLRKPTLRIVEFSINSACQSKCEYCYAAKFRRPGEQMLDVEEVRDIWLQASRMGAFSSLILGGEPTLHPKFLDLVEVLEPRKNMVSFSTNCISLTEEMVVELKKLGVFVIYVSMNSTDAAINDLVRGYEGHHAHVMRVLEVCKRHGIDVVLPVTTSKDLLPETIELVDFARENGLTASMGLLSPTGRAEGERDALFDADFWKTLRELYDRNPDLRGDWDTNFTLEIGCPAGFEKVHVSPYGHVTGCAIQPMSFGSLRERPLASLVEEMRGFKHFAKRSKYCIVALDKEFIEDYIDPAIGEASTPYPIQNNPCAASDCAGCR
jgi:MoaA/NifB/PqqE/SkfB family radical SAM enzyme